MRELGLAGKMQKREICHAQGVSLEKNRPGVLSRGLKRRAKGDLSV